MIELHNQNDKRLIEKVARALMSYDLDLGNPRHAKWKYGQNYHVRQALVERIWRDRVEQAKFILTALEEPLPDGRDVTPSSVGMRVIDLNSIGTSLQKDGADTDGPQQPSRQLAITIADFLMQNRSRRFPMFSKIKSERPG